MNIRPRKNISAFDSCLFKIRYIFVIKLKLIFYRSQDTNEEDKEELIETKASLNNMFHENDQLKLAIVKERYGPRQVPIEAKVKLNILQTENEELKTEVRKFR